CAPTDREGFMERFDDAFREFAARERTPCGQVGRAWTSDDRQTGERFFGDRDVGRRRSTFGAAVETWLSRPDLAQLTDLSFEQRRRRGPFDPCRFADQVLDPPPGVAAEIGP